MVVIKKDLVYDSVNDLKCDFYFPNDTSSNTKILIFWHGGGWFRGDKNDQKALGIKLANAGFMTVIPNYRLTDTATFPAAHDDSVKLIEWLLHSNYTDADDLKNIYQIGASSGGTLALYIAGKYGFPTVTWSAPVDFKNWLEQHEDVTPAKEPAKELNLTNRSAINASFYKFFALNYLGQQTQAKQLDAQAYDYQHLNHLLMINSANELVELAGVFNFTEKLANAGHSVELLILPGTRHAMQYADDYLDESLDFLRQSIKRVDQAAVRKEE